MLAAQGPAQDPASLMLIILAVITGVVVFWRTVIKLATIGLLLLVVLGFMDLLRGLH